MTQCQSIKSPDVVLAKVAAELRGATADLYRLLEGQRIHAIARSDSPAVQEIDVALSESREAIDAYDGEWARRR